MSQDHVLRLRRTDAEGYLLVNISSSGSKVLDLKLVASEGDHVYPLKLKESNIRSLQAEHFKGDLDEWKTLVRYALLQERPSTPLPESLHGLETVAAIKGTTLTVTIRKNVGGITQRQGTIKLEQDDGEEIDPFSWAGTAVARGDDLSQQLDELQISVGKQQEAVAKLNRQLDDLVEAKKEHEEEMLKKFAALLNAKKLKIRDQQRLLAGAKVDPQAAANVSESRNGDSNRSRKAESSRKGKRKANAIPDPEDEEDAKPDEEVDTATEGSDQENLDRAQETPDPSDTEDEASDDEGFAAPPPTERAKRGVGRSNGAAPKGKAKASDAMEVEEEVEPPPPRELPFKSKGGAKASASQASQRSTRASQRSKTPEPAAKAVAEDDEETDEDEL